MCRSGREATEAKPGARPVWRDPQDDTNRCPSAIKIVDVAMLCTYSTASRRVLELWGREKWRPRLRRLQLRLPLVEEPEN